MTDIGDVLSHIENIMGAHGSYEATIERAYNALTGVAEELNEHEKAQRFVYVLGPIHLFPKAGEIEEVKNCIGFTVDPEQVIGASIDGEVPEDATDFMERCDRVLGELSESQRTEVLEKITREEVLERLAKYVPKS